ncbi:MAG: S9 family peptidase [Planctomycetes bacterium]|nr:S9 family peptidase [Planctomycetota bacterium]
MRILAVVVVAGALAACASKPRSISHPAPPAPAGERLTLEDLTSLPARLRADTQLLGWMPGGAQYLASATDREAHKRKLFVVDALSGDRRPFVDVERLTQALASAAGVDQASARRWAERTSFDLTADKRGLILGEQHDLFFCAVDAARALRLTHDAREELGATLSPDGRWLGYVADWNLHVVPTDGSAAPRALTTAGDENHLHGRLDWVYQEELYGRDNFGAFWWSPDSRRIAYLVIDESAVPTYVVTDHRSKHPENERWRYPKAGDPNPVATLHVVDVESGQSTAVDLSRWSQAEPLIVRVGWTPDSTRVVFQVQDRAQTWLDLAEADPLSGATTTWLRDSTGVWIEPDEGPYWIDAGARFLWRSERDGFAHLYLYERGGKLLGRVTQGPWEVDQYLRYDERTGRVFFIADRDDVKGAQLFRCKLDGSDLARLTPEDGRHVVAFSDDGQLFLDTFSSHTTWPQLSVRRADGSLVREIERVDGAVAQAKGVRPPEFLKLKTRDGFELEAAMIKPAGYRAGERYPILCHVYSGPHSPQVLDRPLANGDALFHSMLAQEGYLIWICDNRSASGKGLESARGIYKNLGAQELADIEDGVDWLIEQGYADPQRIGIWGWSYGGYQTAYALTHSKRFRCGIVGAPVTDWRLYDSIYTERYMGLPTENEAGYRASSPQESASEIQGRALLLHGVIDENVHLQNTLQFAERLQRAGREFELMLYPGNRHGIVDPAQNRHKYMTMAAFLRANL